MANVTAIAQQRTELKPSIKGAFNLPIVVGNKAFQDIMKGVIDVDINGQYPLKSGLAFGLGGKVNYFEANDNALTPYITKGSALGWSIYAKAGWEKMLGENTFADMGLNIGFTNMGYDSRQCEGTQKTSGFYLEPKASLYIFATGQLAFGLLLGYQLQFQSFGQEQLCLDELPRHTPEDAEGNLGFITIGLGFSAGLARSANVFR